MISAAQNMCEFLSSAKPLTNASRSLSLTKAGTLLSSLRKSHTPPYTPKHGASLLPPCGAFSFPLTFEQRKAGGSGCTPYGVCPLPPAPQPRWAALLCLQFGDIAVFTLCSVLSACARRLVVSLPLVCSVCYQNARCPLVKAANLPFCLVEQIQYGFQQHEVFNFS